MTEHSARDARRKVLQGAKIRLEEMLRQKPNDMLIRQNLENVARDIESSVVASQAPQLSTNTDPFMSPSTPSLNPVGSTVWTPLSNATHVPSKRHFSPPPMWALGHALRPPGLTSQPATPLPPAEPEIVELDDDDDLSTTEDEDDDDEIQTISVRNSAGSTHSGAQSSQTNKYSSAHVNGYGGLPTHDGAFVNGEASRSTSGKRPYSGIFDNEASDFVIDLTGDEGSNDLKRMNVVRSNQRESNLPNIVSTSAPSKQQREASARYFEHEVLPKLSQGDRGHARKLVGYLESQKLILKRRAKVLQEHLEKMVSELRKYAARSAADGEDSSFQVRMNALQTDRKLQWSKIADNSNKLEMISAELQAVLLGNKTNYTQMLEGYRLSEIHRGESNHGQRVEDKYWVMKQRLADHGSTSSRPFPSLFSHQSSREYYSDAGSYEAGGSGAPDLDAKDLEKLLSTIEPDDEVSPADREKTPKELAISLLEHQKLGLTWLLKMENTVRGGILADDMGLGKTIQAL
jgi:hypothetical protein